MPRKLYTPSTQPPPDAPDRLLLFIQRAQLEMVYCRRREGRLPLHDSFRLTLGARTADAGSRPGGDLRSRRGAALRPTIYDPGSDTKPAA
jgi:hypothetical protein